MSIGAFAGFLGAFAVILAAFLTMLHYSINTTLDAKVGAIKELVDAGKRDHDEFRKDIKLLNTQYGVLTGQINTVIQLLGGNPFQAAQSAQAAQAAQPTQAAKP